MSSTSSILLRRALSRPVSATFARSSANGVQHKGAVASFSTFASSSSNFHHDTLTFAYVHSNSAHPRPTTAAATTIITIRHFGRKAAKVGHHLESAEDLATRPDREAARDKRKKKKAQKKGNRHQHAHQSDGDDVSSQEEESPKHPSEAALDEVDLHLEEDASETTFFEHGSDDDLPFLPDSDDVKARMVKVVTAMEESFRSIRGAEPTPELFEPILVRAYGELTPLSAVAQVVISSPKQATLTCYDPEVANAVRDAVRDSGLNFNPRIEDGGVVIVPIPKVSMETRQQLVKQLGKAAEACRQRVRRIRRAAQDVVKKGKDGKLEGVSKDDAFRVAKDIDAVTEEVIALLNRKVEEKQDSVMSV